MIVLSWNFGIVNTDFFQSKNAATWWLQKNLDVKVNFYEK